MQSKDFIFSPASNSPLSLLNKAIERKFEAFGANLTTRFNAFLFLYIVKKCVSMKFILNKIHYMNS